MATFRTFEELDIWKKAREFSARVYSHTTSGSFSKDFALRDQINKSTGSIMDNIAEGFERGGNREFIVFLAYAKGSAGEARSQISRAYDRRHIDEDTFNDLSASALEISKAISGFMSYLKRSSYKGSRLHEPDENYDTTSSTDASGDERNFEF